MANSRAAQIMLPSRPRLAAATHPQAKSSDADKIRKHTITPPTSDRVDRTSFSSIKENASGVAQSFTDSKTSSYLRHEFALVDGSDEDAIVDDSSSLSSGSAGEVSRSSTPVLERKGALPEPVPPPSGRMLHPYSALHGFVSPAEGFMGWKSISIRGKTASKSFGDLRSLAKFEWEPKVEEKRVVIESGKTEEPVAGQSPFEKLPAELLGAIIDQLVTDIPPNGIIARNIDLMSLLLTSKSIHSATLATLYAQITIPHSRIFRKFLSHITEYPALGTIVRRLDFSHFNPTGAGISKKERDQTLNLIPTTLLQCLDLTPNLREFLAQEHIDDDLDAKVIQKILCDLPKLKALDFCACSSAMFKNSFMEVVGASTQLPDVLPITRLGFHECTIIPSSAYDILLPRLPKLTHLDVAHTRITDAALHSIPTTARLTHLNLSKCSYLSGEAVIDFLTNHPAASTLVYLNLGMDAKSHEMLTVADITALLPILPTTLRSLSLKGSKMDSSHIPLLLPLTKHLEELGLGRNLTLDDITALFIPSQDLPLADQLAWIPHTLHYIDVSDLSLAALDLGTLFGMRCPVLQPTTSPLEVLEVSPDIANTLAKRKPMVDRVKWCMKEAGRRYWLVREGVKDSGAREWKWGASYWGMRKVPVVRAEVGGMYGHYMFRR